MYSTKPYSSLKGRLSAAEAGGSFESAGGDTASTGVNFTINILFVTKSTTFCP
jgi:hypothetical protein